MHRADKKDRIYSEKSVKVSFKAFAGSSKQIFFACAVFCFFCFFFTAWAHFYTMELTGNYFDYGCETCLEKEKGSREKLKGTVDMINRREEGAARFRGTTLRVFQSDKRQGVTFVLEIFFLHREERPL